jgi:hypothetical protein
MNTYPLASAMPAADLDTVEWLSVLDTLPLPDTLQACRDQLLLYICLCQGVLSMPKKPLVVGAPVWFTYFDVSRPLSKPALFRTNCPFYATFQRALYLQVWSISEAWTQGLAVADATSVVQSLYRSTGLFAYVLDNLKPTQGAEGPEGGLLELGIGMILCYLLMVFHGSEDTAVKLPDKVTLLQSVQCTLEWMLRISSLEASQRKFLEDVLAFTRMSVYGVVGRHFTECKVIGEADWAFTMAQRSAGSAPFPYAAQHAQVQAMLKDMRYARLTEEPMAFTLGFPSPTSIAAVPSLHQIRSVLLEKIPPQLSFKVLTTAELPIRFLFAAPLGGGTLRLPLRGNVVMDSIGDGGLP